MRHAAPSPQNKERLPHPTSIFKSMGLDGLQNDLSLKDPVIRRERMGRHAAESE